MGSKRKRSEDTRPPANPPIWGAKTSHSFVQPGPHLQSSPSPSASAWCRPGASPAPVGIDVLVVGSGINGAGIARELAGRGQSVLPCEKDDMASHTASSSTQLIHGGLRCLDHHEFLLVRKALARRELLPGSTTIGLRQHAAGKPLKPGFSKGFVYADGPWAAQVLNQQAHVLQRRALRLVKGSRGVVVKLSEHDSAYIFQNPYKRIIFAIPYEGEITLIGTTDVQHYGVHGAEVAQGRIEAELNYLHTHEWARSAVDLLWRRAKLGLHFSAAEGAAVAHCCAAHWLPVAAQAAAGQLPMEDKAWS